MQSVVLIGHGTGLRLADGDGRHVEVTTADGALTFDARLLELPEDARAAVDSLNYDVHRDLRLRATHTGHRDSVRERAEALVCGQGTRTDRAYRRGLRGRGQRC